jgi:hypothetical protein
VIPTMRQLLLFIFILTTLNLNSQRMKITTLDKAQLEATILDEKNKNQLLQQFNGKQNNSLRKKWTARTYVLSDGRSLIEFYDRQAALINNVDDLKKLDRIRFVKNTVDFLKKNITYKIELTFEEGNRIIQNEKLNRLSNLKSDMPEYYNFEVYELTAGQILFLDKSQNFKSATIYPDLKTLSSDNNTIQEQIYSSDDDEYLMKKLASGDALLDYEPNDHLIYPKYLKDLIINHKLSPIEQMVYVADFFGNLYKSENGYYILVDEVNQKNGAGNKMRILNLRVYDSLEQVRQAQKKYEVFKNKEVTSEHFYQKISDKYGENFPKFVPQLIDTLPTLLNFDKEQLSTDSAGIDLVDEALKWNGTNYELFDTWFPSVLAYYGECYIKNKQEGKWTMYFNGLGIGTEQEKKSGQFTNQLLFLHDVTLLAIKQ